VRLVAILNFDKKNGNCLSTIRNNLNYRRDYGAWYPHCEGQQWAQGDTFFRSFLADPMRSVTVPESKIIVRFAKRCALVVSLFVELTGILLIIFVRKYLATGFSIGRVM
jgi:hypothetical protein